MSTRKNPHTIGITTTIIIAVAAMNLSYFYAQHRYNIGYMDGIEYADREQIKAGESACYLQVIGAQLETLKLCAQVRGTPPAPEDLAPLDGVFPTKAPFSQDDTMMGSLTAEGLADPITVCCGKDGCKPCIYTPNHGSGGSTVNIIVPADTRIPPPNHE